VEDFRALVFRFWRALDSSLDDNVMKRYVNDLKSLKRIIGEWAKNWAMKVQKYLKEIEERMKILFKHNEVVFF